MKKLLKNCDWIINIFFFISNHNAVSSFFDTKRFNTYPSLLKIFNILFEKFSEIYIIFALLRSADKRFL